MKTRSYGHRELLTETGLMFEGSDARMCQYQGQSMHVMTQDHQEAASLGALHESAERDPPQNCHPKTLFAGLFWTGSITKVPRFLSSGFMGLARQRSCAELLCAVHPDPTRIGKAAFFFFRGESGRNRANFLYQLALKVLNGLSQEEIRCACIQLGTAMRSCGLTATLVNAWLAGYLQQYPHPNQAKATNSSLAFRNGRGGARLSHGHSKQCAYVLQSLTLWREILHGRGWGSIDDTIQHIHNKIKGQHIINKLNSTLTALSFCTGYDIENIFQAWLPCYQSLL